MRETLAASHLLIRSWQLYRESGPYELIFRFSQKLVDAAGQLFRRYVDECKSTYHFGDLSGIHLQGFLSRYSCEKLCDYKNDHLPVYAHYLYHRFDLLGSGWVRVHHGMKCRGLEGYKYDMGDSVHVDGDGKWLEGRINSSNLAEAQKIWALVDLDYMPIDWQIDFKSGFRWSEKTWYRNIKFGHKLGVDVKVPWELARMQHLPQLAIYCLSLPVESNGRETLQREFRNQVLDFIATNPPRYGVNWACPMDVSIRAVNWLMAYDLFHSGYVHFDEEFKSVFSRSIYEHGLHIVMNLEWHKTQRGNHYLADIAGLSFIAASLSATAQTDAWLAFAVQELITEVERQFYPDGGNFEGSTAYHRLSAEMVYFATSLILGLPQERAKGLKDYDHRILRTGLGKPKLKPAPLTLFKHPQGSVSSIGEGPFPGWYFERMERMAEFVMDITKPNGDIPQIGDNDSGRFFKLGPKYEQMTVKQTKELYANLDRYSELPDDAVYHMEDQLDCSHLVAAAFALFERNDFVQWLGGKEKALSMPDYFCVKAVSGCVSIGSQHHIMRQKENSDYFKIGTQNGFKNALSETQAKPKEQVRIKEYQVQEGDLHEGCTLRAYPDFGLYLFTSPRLYMAVRCWAGREPFHSSHMHNDQLSVELVIDDRALATDPGTYIYTPLPFARIRYRSAPAHFSPLPDTDTLAGDESNVFEALKSKPAQVEYFGSIGFCGSTEKSSDAFNLVALIQKNSVCVYHSGVNMQSYQVVRTFEVATSPGYGIVLR